MPTTAMVAHRLAPAMGVSDRTARRIALKLQDAHLLPPVAHGGPRTRSPVLDHRQVITYALALAAPGMVEQVAGTVARVATLREQLDTNLGAPLQDTLTSLITKTPPDFFVANNTTLKIITVADELWATLEIKTTDQADISIQHTDYCSVFDSLSQSDRIDRFINIGNAAPIGTSREVVIYSPVFAILADMIHQK